MSFQTSVIDMENDWKLLTILIGGNDLCDSKLHVLPQSYVRVHKPMLLLCDLMDCLLNYPDTSLIPRLMHKSIGTCCINT